VALPPFAVTFDYRCPFARNVHEHLVVALEAGADWQVRFLPFSLSQAKADPGGARWDAADDSGLLALAAGIAVRDTQPEHFLAAHRALFALRHDHGGNLRDERSLRDALAGAGVDADAALAEVDGGAPVATVRAEHEAAVAGHDVWGVPTFVSGDRAAFVRLMDRPADAGSATTAVTRIVELLDGWPDLNEFKHTTLPR
jgi:hypothetical protein